jgi:energy-coupling factor transporter ATP-binding protein EcfA2
MPDPRTVLQSKYLPQNRYANFGPSLKSIRIRGFRGIHDLKVDLLYPITAISGLNGAGKSTVGQLCLGAYRKPSTVKEPKRFYVRDFFPASAADPNPFGPKSSVVFEYNTSDPAAPQTLTVARAAKEWSGYKRQPERSCYYIGFTIYIPKVEQRDLSMYRSQQLTLGPQRPIPEGVRECVGRILGQQYEGMHFQGITRGQRSGELGIAQRFGAQYSENNMGFGEGRTLYLVDLMEHSPEQSLFVIEEPETSLHGNAQHELAKYLVEVCHRRHHQVVLSTHSSTILDALPAVARVMLLRDAAGVAAFPQISAARAKSMLTGGRHRDLSVLVEDPFAKLLLTEMIRRVDPGLLTCIDIFDVGNTKDVRSGALLMARINRPFAAVRDADVGPDLKNGLLSFPGTMPPEQEVYMRAEVQAQLAAEFGVDVGHLFAQQQVSNHHDFTKVLAAQTSTLPDFLSTLAVRAYLDAIGKEAYQQIVADIQARLP